MTMIEAKTKKKTEQISLKQSIDFIHIICARVRLYQLPALSLSPPIHTFVRAHTHTLARRVIITLFIPHPNAERYYAIFFLIDIMSIINACEWLACVRYNEILAISFCLIEMIELQITQYIRTHHTRS